MSPLESHLFAWPLVLGVPALIVRLVMLYDRWRPVTWEEYEPD